MNTSWILIIVIGIVGMLVQWKLKSVFAKYSKVLSPGGMTGAQIAQSEVCSTNFVITLKLGSGLMISETILQSSK